MLMYAVENSGVIGLRELKNGDIAIEHTGTGKVVELITSICTPERGYWHQKYLHWVVHAACRDCVIDELDARATPIAGDNVRLLRRLPAPPSQMPIESNS